MIALHCRCTPIQRRWIDHALQAYNITFTASSLDHYGDWARLAGDVDALPPWVQATMWVYVYDVKLWDYVFIDAGNVPAPPPPPNGTALASLTRSCSPLPPFQALTPAK